MKMMKEFINKMNDDELEELAQLIKEQKQIRDKDFVKNLMDNVVNALDRAQAELLARYGDNHYIILEVNGYTYYFDNDVNLEIIIENKNDECDSQSLYTSFLKGE